jgi:hypothetical protein
VERHVGGLHQPGAVDHTARDRSTRAPAGRRCGAAADVAGPGSVL